MDASVLGRDSNGPGKTDTGGAGAARQLVGTKEKDRDCEYDDKKI
jgi:hypothetical protein